MLAENLVRVKLKYYEDNIKNHQYFKITVPSLFYLEVLQKAFNPLYTSELTTKSQWQIWQTLTNGLKWHMACVFLCVKYIYYCYYYDYDYDYY